MAIQVHFDGVLIKQLGAYVKTDLSAIRQINGVATGVVAALGLAEGGEDEVAHSIRSHAEAVAIFKSGPLVDHIKTMFLGGAGEVIGVRIGAPTAAELGLEFTDGDTTPTLYTLDFDSLEKSKRSNSILVQFDVDDAGTAGSTTDDKLVLTVMQKNPDCSVTKEIYEFPRVFMQETVMYRRGKSLSFVQDWIVQQGLSTLGASPTLADKQAAVSAVLQDMLLPDDYVQFFDVGAPLPIGLAIYEVVKGGLFGYEKSRIVSMTINNETADSTVELPSAFNVNPTTFFNPATSAYEFTTVALSTFNADQLITNNAALLSDYYALSGGSNGDDGTGLFGTGLVTTTSTSTQMQSWISGLQVLEQEEVNFVQPAYHFHYSTQFGDASTPGPRETFFNAVMGYVIGHVKLMSSVNQRKRRTSIIGFPAPHNDTYQKSAYLDIALSNLTSLTSDTDRVQDWVAPFHSSVVTGNRALLGGEFFASYIAGRHANREPQISITFNPVGSLGADFLYDWTYSEKDRIISNRKGFVEKVKNSFGAQFYRVHHNPTGWLGAVTQGYQEFILRRIDDYVSTYLFKNVEETFIGRPSFGASTSAQIQRYVESLLASLVGKQIVAFRDVQVSANEDRTVYNVDFFVQPVTEIKFVLMTMKVTFELE